MSKRTMGVFPTDAQLITLSNIPAKPYGNAYRALATLRIGSSEYLYYLGNASTPKQIGRVLIGSTTEDPNFTIDTTRWATGAPVSIVRAPSAAPVMPVNDLYVLLSNSNVLGCIKNGTTVTSVSLANRTSSSSTMAVSALMPDNGHFLVFTDLSNNQIVKLDFDAAGHMIRETTIADSDLGGQATVDYPINVFVSPQGDIYVVNFQAGSVTWIPTTNGVFPNTEHLPLSLQTPPGVVATTTNMPMVGDDMQIFVGGSSGQFLRIYNPRAQMKAKNLAPQDVTKLEYMTIPTLNEAITTGMALTDSGDFYASGTQADILMVPGWGAGTPVRTTAQELTADPSLTTVAGIAYSSSDNLFAYTNDTSKLLWLDWRASVTSATLPPGMIGEPYRYQFTGNGEIEQFMLDPTTTNLILAPGTGLPAGLRLAPDGLLQGTIQPNVKPTNGGPLYEFGVYAIDDQGKTGGTTWFSMSIMEPVPVMDDSSLPKAEVGAVYDGWQFTSNPPAARYALSTDTQQNATDPDQGLGLPKPLTLSASGQISKVAIDGEVKPGVYRFGVRGSSADDGQGPVNVFEMVVEAVQIIGAPTMEPANLQPILYNATGVSLPFIAESPDGYPVTGYEIQTSQNRGDPGEGLPNGLTFNGTGAQATITGDVAKVQGGQYTFRIRARNDGNGGNNWGDWEPYTLDVHAPPVWVGAAGWNPAQENTRYQYSFADRLRAYPPVKTIAWAAGTTVSDLGGLNAIPPGFPQQLAADTLAVDVLLPQLPFAPLTYFFSITASNGIVDESGKQEVTSKLFTLEVDAEA